MSRSTESQPECDSEVRVWNVGRTSHTHHAFCVITAHRNIHSFSMIQNQNCQDNRTSDCGTRIELLIFGFVSSLYRAGLSLETSSLYLVAARTSHLLLLLAAAAAMPTSKRG
jgi:hypothetical protein